MTSRRRPAWCWGRAASSARPGRSGALCALEEVEGFDPREADVIVGTSAGSILGALLGAGVPAGSLRDHQLGLPIDGLEYDYESGSGGATPGRPRLGIGSPALLWRTAGTHCR